MLLTAIIQGITVRPLIKVGINNNKILEVDPSVCFKNIQMTMAKITRKVGKDL